MLGEYMTDTSRDQAAERMDPSITLIQVIDASARELADTFDKSLKDGR